MRGLPASGKLWLQSFLCAEFIEWQLQFNAAIDRVALGWDSAHFQNEGLKILWASVLAGGRTRFARNIFFHQRPAVIVSSCMQAELREAAVQLYPRNLNVVDGAGEQQARERVNLEMLGERGAGAGETLLKQNGVLMHEAERDEFGKASEAFSNSSASSARRWLKSS